MPLLICCKDREVKVEDEWSRKSQLGNLITRRVDASRCVCHFILARANVQYINKNRKLSYVVLESQETVLAYKQIIMPPKRTRSTHSKPAAPTSTESPSDSQRNEKTSLVTDNNPPYLAILPGNLSKEAQFYSLPNPATSELSRYIYDPENGFYELTQVGGQGQESSPRSVLLSRPALPVSQADGADQKDEEASVEQKATKSERARPQDGYILRDSKILTATPFNPLFLLTSLVPSTAVDPDTNRPHMARLADDHFDTLAENSNCHMRQLLKRHVVRRRLQDALNEISESVDLGGGEMAYRLSVEKLLETLVCMARRAVDVAWPLSLEERVKRELELPAVTTSKQECIKMSENASASQELDKTEATEEASPQTNVPSQDVNDIPHNVLHTHRLRTSLNFLLSRYIPPRLQPHLTSLLATNKSINFTDLDAHLAHVETLHKEARALQSMSDNISRKRSRNDDEAAEERAEKKRKKEEEEKKQKNENRAIKNLKKADVSGMKTLSSFFGAAKAKA